MKSTVKIIVALMLCFISFNSCKQATTAECSQCKVETPNKKVTMLVGTTKIKTDVWKDDEAKYVFAAGKIDGNASTIASEFLNYQNPNAEEISGVMLFVNSDLTADTVVSLNNIVGYGIYFRQENKLRFQFFVKENGVYNMIAALNSEAKKLSTNDVFNLAKLYFLNDKMITSGYTIINKDDFFKPNESKSHTMGYNIKYLLRKKNINTVGKSTRPNEPKCKIPCSGGEHECEQTLHSYSCDHTSEEENDVAQASFLIEEESLPLTYIDSAYDIELHYWLRDSFLTRTVKGNQYIGYYYGMNPSSYLTAQIMLNTPPFLMELNDRIERMLDGDTTVVLIDSAFAVQAQTLLSYYKSAAPSQVERNNFDAISNDIEFFTGMTAPQIYDAINYPN